MKSKKSALLEVFSKKENTRLLLSGKWGLEKESLRVTSEGDLALTNHPKSLGSSFTSPYITTDFSESQVELITPPEDNIEKVFHFLQQSHWWVSQNIESEQLWPLSMPGRLPESENILIASYGDSPEAKQREIYRRGLALRYGKKMQMICGLHYNFSFADDLFEILYKRTDQAIDFRTFKDEKYFDLSRNFLRYRWLLVYLFGASPVVDASYQKEVIECLERFGDDGGRASYHKANAISLRMSKYGYSNTCHTNVRVSYDRLAPYLEDLQKALNKKEKRYTEMGLFRDGQPVQLNDHLLQIENEYYAPIRFKQSLEKGETMSQALCRRGVNHIEIRALDLDPFEPIGVGLDKLYFLQVFFLFCLFEESDSLDLEERAMVNKNQRLVALRGRENDLLLKKNKTESIPLPEWGRSLFQELKSIARLLDKASEKGRYGQVVQAEESKLYHRALLPSSRMIQEMEASCESFVDYGLRLLKENKNKNISIDSKTQDLIKKSILK